MVEAGNYYDFKAKNKIIEDPCPFCLYGPLLKNLNWFISN